LPGLAERSDSGQLANQVRPAQLLLQHVKPVIAGVAVAGHEPAEVRAQQPLGGLLRAARIDPVADHEGGRGGPQPARLATAQPCRLVGMDRLRRLDRLVQLAPRIVQHAADAAQHPVDGAAADRDRVGLPQQLADLLARQAMRPGEHCDVRVQPGPERAHRHPGGQIGQCRTPAPRARQAMAAPLTHLGHDQRQIPLLMSDRLTDRLLDAGEAVPTPADRRHAIDRPAGQLIQLGRRPA